MKIGISTPPIDRVPSMLARVNFRNCRMGRQVRSSAKVGRSGTRSGCVTPAAAVVDERTWPIPLGPCSKALRPICCWVAMRAILRPCWGSGTADRDNAVAGCWRSRDHWTEPWGFRDERLFLNRAILVDTTLAPRTS